MSDTTIPEELVLIKDGVSRHVDGDEQVRMGVKMNNLDVINREMS